MADRSNVSTGSCLGMATVAVVSTGVILASYRLIHRRLESNRKLNNTIARAEQQWQSRTKKKKVWFTDDVTTTDSSADGDEYRRLRPATTGASGLVHPALRKAAYSSTHLAC